MKLELVEGVVLVAGGTGGIGAEISSIITENLFPERVTSRAWLRTFRLALLDKDLGVAVKVLEDNGVASGAIRTAKEAFAAGREALGEEADHVELVKEIEKAAGVEIK